MVKPLLRLRETAFPVRAHQSAKSPEAGKKSLWSSPPGRPGAHPDVHLPCPPRRPSRNFPHSATSGPLRGQTQYTLFRLPNAFWL